jgi:NADPH:quinone reductase
MIKELPVPKPGPGEVLIEVKAFGLNRAEIYFRKGLWGQVANVSGIEGVGLIAADPEKRFKPGQKAIALVGGMGRTINGSYAEFRAKPAKVFTFDEIQSAYRLIESNQAGGKLVVTV